MSEAFFLSPSRFGVIDQSFSCLMKSLWVSKVLVDRVYPIKVKPVLSWISHVIYQALKLSFKRK